MFYEWGGADGNGDPHGLWFNCINYPSLAIHHIGCSVRFYTVYFKITSIVANLLIRSKVCH